MNSPLPYDWTNIQSVKTEMDRRKAKIEQLSEANQALVLALDTIRDILNGVNSDTDGPSIMVIVNHALAVNEKTLG